MSGSNTQARQGAWRRIVLGVVVVATATAGAFVVHGGSAAANRGAASRPAVQSAPATAKVAQSQLRDTRAVLTAVRRPGDTATVRLTVFRRTAGGWRSLGTQIVGERRGWFWNVVSRASAVCDFAVSNTPRRRVEVRLAISPSIGCSTTSWHFHVERGALVPG